MLGLVGRRSISMTFNTDADQQLMLPPLDNAKNHLDQVSLTARLLWEFIVSCHQLLLHTLLHCAPWHSAARTPAISIAHDVTVDPFARWLPAASQRCCGSCSMHARDGSLRSLRGGTFRRYCLTVVTSLLRACACFFRTAIPKVATLCIVERKCRSPSTKQTEQYGERFPFLN